jgi:PAS domain S-box-containing protein
MKLNKVIVALTVIILTIISFLLFALHKSTEDEMINRFYAQQLTASNQISSTIKSFLSIQSQGIEKLASLTSIKHKDGKSSSADIQEYFDKVKGNGVKAISVYNGKGKIIYSTSKNVIGRNYGQLDFFQWSLKKENEGDQFVSSLIQKSENKTRPLPYFHILLVSPIYQESKNASKYSSYNKFVGVITETIDLKEVLTAFLPLVSPYAAIENVWIVDKDGTLLFQSEHQEMALSNIKEHDKSCMQCHTSFDYVERILSAKKGSFEYELKDKPKKLASFVSLEFKNISWKIVLNLPSEAVTGFLTKHHNMTLLLIGLIALTILGGSLKIYQSNYLRKKAEDDVKKFREQQTFNLILESAGEGIFGLDLDGYHTFVNPAAAKLLGYKIEELVGKYSHSIWHHSVPSGELYPCEDCHIYATIKDGISHSGEEYFWRKDGSGFPVDFSTTPILENGKIIGAVVIFRDISERKRADMQLFESKAMLVKAQEIGHMGSWEWDIVTNETTWSEEVFRLYGLDPEKDRSNYDVVINTLTPECREDFLRAIEDALKGKKSFAGEYCINLPDRSQRYTYTKGEVLHDLKGNPIKMHGMVQDITERKRAEEELIKAKNLAESADKLKDAFIANISHEIRTPLNGILGMTSLIHETYPQYATKEDEKFFTSIERSSKRLINTVDKILNYSLLQIGDFPVNVAGVSLSTVLQFLIHEYNPLADEKSIKIHFKSAIKDDTVFADEVVLNTALGNLIDNAIKFTNAGFIDIVLYENEQCKLCIDIRDTGTGISEEYLPGLFEPYSQEGIGYSRPYEGLGLGLAIAKKLLGLNGASIAVKSKKGVGTVFSIYFDKQGIKLHNNKSIITEEIKTQSPKTPVNKKPLILVVEDDSVNQLYFKQILKKEYNIEMAANSDEALKLFTSRSFDLILMDISLKEGINGLEITKIIRGGKENPNIPIIAVTGHAFPGDYRQAMEAGCNEYLIKPFKKSQLINKISSLISI